MLFCTRDTGDDDDVSTVPVLTFGQNKELYPRASDDNLVGNAGSNVTSVDVNGVTRPQGTASDIGAYEYRNTWTGSTNTDWATASNWSLNQVPSTTSAYDAPKIANVSLGQNDPIISSDITIDNLEIENGATLTIAKPVP